MTLSRSLTARALLSVGAMLLTAVPTLLPMADGAEWGVRFPPADGAVRDRLEFELRPGGSAADAIELINRSDAELIVTVLPVDAEYGTDSLAFAVEGEPVAAGLWLTPRASTHRLPASTEQPLDFVVSVPTDAAPGTYAAALRLTQRAEVMGTGASSGTGRGVGTSSGTSTSAGTGTGTGTGTGAEEIPVQRTIVVIAHINVSGETGLAETAAPVAGWITASVITAGVLLILAGIVALILLRARAPRRAPE